MTDLSYTVNESPKYLDMRNAVFSVVGSAAMLPDMGLINHIALPIIVTLQEWAS